MKTKRLIALICALIMALSLCACKNTAVSDGTTESTETAETAAVEDATVTTLMNDEVAKMFDTDEVVCTVGGRDITWGDFYPLMHYYKGYVEYNIGEIDNWNTTLTGSSTAQEVVKGMCVQWLQYDAAVRAGAEKLGVELTEEDYAALENELAELEESVGGAEELDARLESNNLTRTFYNMLNETSALADKCYAFMYGENGANISDEDCAEYTADDGYLMAKHILLKTTTTDDDGNSVDMTDDEKDEVYGKAKAILEKLDACSSDELESVFTEIMNEESEDIGGLVIYPDGYLFQDGEMVTEFEEGTKALEIGEYSGIIETTYGYHIILRLPINYDCTPNQYSSYLKSGNNTYTLRNLVGIDMFDAIVDGWTEDITVTYGKLYSKLDFTELYK